MLTKDAILAANDLPYEDVEVPEWGGAVRIKTITAAERDAWESTWTTGEGDERRQNLDNWRARLVALCLVNDKGERLFADAAELGRKSNAVIRRLYDVARRVNGMNEKSLDSAEKN